MAEKTEVYTTPAGKAMWPKLITPDTKYNDDGTYSVKLVLAEKDSQELLKLIERAEKEAADMFLKEKPKAKKIPWQDTSYKKVEDEDGSETGEWQFNIKMIASGVSKKTGKAWAMRPKIFDASGKPIKGNLDIWSGTIMKVALTVNPYYRAGKCGASLRLEAVQILELVLGSGAKADEFGFGEEEGYAFDENDCAEETPTNTDGDNSDAQTDDDKETDF